MKTAPEPFHISQVSKKTEPLRVERYWVGGECKDLEVHRIPLEYLYFNIKNGRYRDRMIKLEHEHPGKEIDPRSEEWKTKIEEMLAGEHKDTSRDKGPFETLMQDLENKVQLRPGVVLADGGVIDGNRRLAALRRLHKTRAPKFGYFDAVILPDDTKDEDRWRIEAGLQLGTNERWDYSPINEMLKIREGVEMYEVLIQARGSSLKGQSAVRLVTQAIYGKSEADVQEMLARLRLIDDYLTFTGQEGAYHAVGGMSEDFKEATQIMSAATNHQLEPNYLGKLRAVLFYLIDQELMDNWQLRKIRDALGGDPKRRGRKPEANKEALDELFAAFPQPKEIAHNLLQLHKPSAPLPAPLPPPSGDSKLKAGAKVKKDAPAPTKPPVDKGEVEAKVANFLQRVATAGKKKSLRKAAEGARGGLQALEAELSKAEVRDGLEADERAALLGSLESMQPTVTACIDFLRPKATPARGTRRSAKPTS